MTLADRLKAARESTGLIQRDFATKINTSFRAWQDYEAGKNVPGGKVFESLALLGFDVNWLLTGEGTVRREESVTVGRIAEEPGGHPMPEDGSRRLDDRYCYIPLYNVRASAGGGAVVDRETVVDFLSFKAEWIRTQLNAAPTDLYLIHVEGESMEPTLRPGDVILVDHREASALPRDGIYVVRMDDTLLVKRLQRLPGAQVRVTSDNPAYQPFMMNLAATDHEFNIVGRVVWCARRM